MVPDVVRVVAHSISKCRVPVSTHTPEGIRADYRRENGASHFPMTASTEVDNEECGHYRTIWYTIASVRFFVHIVRRVRVCGGIFAHEYPALAGRVLGKNL